MDHYGLIGYPVSHSFSERYFTEKFAREGIAARYFLFSLPEVANMSDLWREHPYLRGLNVTIPHKQAVIPMLDRVDSSAARVGAVNVIRREADGTLTGFNSDYFGFQESLKSFIGSQRLKALVLGTGGSARAVTVALSALGIDFRQVSRTAGRADLTYADLDGEIITEHQLIINTTPLGMHPDVTEAPTLPYNALTPGHFLFDLVYNPAETVFLRRGRTQGACVRNGLDMLYRQADRAWEIWQHG